MKKVVIYGLGRNFHKNEMLIRKKYEIVGIADGNPVFVGTYYCGLKIIAPDKIDEIEYDYILITPNSYLEIKKHLLLLSIPEDKIKVLNDEKLRDDEKKNNANIVFSICGGMGDILIAFNYVYTWAVKYKNDNCTITVICDKCDSLLNNLGYSENYISEVRSTTEYHKYIELSDLFIDIRRYPQVIKFSEYVIASLAPNVIDYVLGIIKFQMFHPELLEDCLLADGLSCEYELKMGHKRINQPNIYNMLSLGETYVFEISVNNNLKEKYNPDGRKLITIHRGCDKVTFSDENVKLWDVKNYENLLKRIKEEFPEYKLVLLGEEYERHDLIKSYDSEYLGKTDFEDLKYILKNSCLHIDTEGGLVHLRHALNGGKSLVLFGPTDAQFYGYSENINIRTDACSEACEWKTLDWNTNCRNKNNIHVCMKSITVDNVMHHLREALQ